MQHVGNVLIYLYTDLLTIMNIIYYYIELKIIIFGYTTVVLPSVRRDLLLKRLLITNFSQAKTKHKTALTIARIINGSPCINNYIHE